MFTKKRYGSDIKKKSLGVWPSGVLMHRDF
jgi:hypothetical protein